MASNTSPTGLLMLFKAVGMVIFALIIEIIGYVVLAFGADDVGILDAIGLIGFGLSALIDYVIKRGEIKAKQAARSDEEEEEEQADLQLPERPDRKGKEETQSAQASGDKKASPTEQAAKQTPAGSAARPAPAPAAPAPGKASVKTAGKTLPKGGTAAKALSPAELVKAEIKKLAQKTLKSLGLTTLGEVIPYVGVIVPFWTISAIRKLWALLRDPS